MLIKLFYILAVLLAVFHLLFGAVDALILGLILIVAAACLEHAWGLD